MASAIIRAAGLTCAMLNCLLVAGCGNLASNQSAATDDSHLKFVADSYGLFLKEHRRLPSDDAEFREFVTKLASDNPVTTGKSVDQLLTSTRDGKPFGLFTSASPPPAGSPWAAYEQVGVDGRRLIADTAGKIQEVDDVAFRAMMPKSP